MIRHFAAAAALAMVAAAPAPSAAPRAGRWEATIRPRAIPLPEQVAREQGAMLRGLMTEAYTARICLKRALAADPKPLFAFTGSEEKRQKSCTATRIELRDGKLLGEASCTEGGLPMQGSIAGTYRAGELYYDITRVHGGLDAPGTIALSVDAKRTGGCG